MFSRHHRKVRVFFALADLLLGCIAFEGAYYSRSQIQLYHYFEIDGPSKALLLVFSLLTLVLTAVWFRIYEQLDSAPLTAKLRETTRQTVITVIAVVLFEYVLRLDLSRPFLFLFGGYLWVLLTLFRLRANRFVQWFGSPHYLMIVGTGESATRIARTIEESADYGLHLSGFIADRHDSPAPDNISNPVYALADLPRLLDQHVIDELIFAVDSSRLAELEDVFLLCDEEGVRTRVACDFFPHINSNDVYLDRLGNAPLLTFSAAPHDELRLIVKRLTDIAIAATALVLLSPLLLLVGLLVRITSPGPALFRQVRCGLNGRRFTFYKFRSMCQNAEDLKDSLQHLNERTEIVFKIKDDPRLTPIGRWLRKFSLDELPQLWNVLRGDMSIVGPRPPVPEEVLQYERWQRRRLRMRPGLTCIWAISGRDSVDFETWMKMDMQYIDNWSLALDWKIMIQTIPRVLTGKGAS